MGDLFKKFLDKYNGQSNVGNTPENMGQCVGLVEVWNDEFLKFQHEWGNAVDLLKNADTSLFDVIFNDPKDYSQFPLCGDILVFDSSWGNGFGHTGVIDEATGKDFILFEQNNPEGNPCELIGHPDYVGVLGWLHPKGEKVFVTSNQTVTLDGDKFHELVDKSTKYDAFVAAGFPTADDAIKQLKEVRDENTGLKTELSQSESARATLAGELEKKSTEDSTAIDTGVVAQQERDAYHQTIDSLAKQLGTLPRLKEMSDEIDSLQHPHNKVVEEYQKLGKELEDFFYKRQPQWKKVDWGKVGQFFSWIGEKLK